MADLLPDLRAERDMLLRSNVYRQTQDVGAVSKDSLLRHNSAYLLLTAPAEAARIDAPLGS